MKHKQLWMSVTLTVLALVCAMLIFSRAGERDDSAASARPGDVDLILPPQTTEAVQKQTYDDLPDIDITSWEYTLVNQTHSIDKYVPETAPIEGSGSAFDARAVDALHALLRAAKDAGYTPYIYCAYRPYSTQESQFRNEVAQYIRQGYSETDANKAAARVVAEPGKSDHQLGLSADVVDQYYAALDVTKVDSQMMQWLAAHCAEYGFIVRYPADKIGVTGLNEPWHVRYVGKEAAQFMMRHGLCLEEFVSLYE